MDNQRSKSWLRHAIVLMLLVLIVFGRMASSDFIWLDDPIHTFANPYLRHVTFADLAHFWLHPYKGLYIPVSYMAFAALADAARVSGTPMSDTGALLNPRVFHVASIAVHIANVFLVLVLLRRIVRDDIAAFAGALLFAIHPIQVESVAWIAEMRGLLCGLFSLACLLVYVREKRLPAHYIASFAFFVLALLSKPSAVVLPLIAAIMDALVYRRSWRSILLESTPAIVVSGLVLMVTRSQQSLVDSIDVAPWLRPLVAGDACCFYLAKLFVPIGLCIDYGRTPLAALADPLSRVEWIVPMALVGIAWALARRAPYASAGIGVFLVALLPVLGLVPFRYQYYSTVADRYGYFAMLGAALLLAGGVASLRKLERIPSAPAVFLGAVLFVAMALTAESQCRVWVNTGTVMRQALTVNPQSAVAYVQLGNWLAVRGHDDLAMADFRQAERLRPEMAVAHYDVAGELSKAGRYREALDEYGVALRIDPDNVEAQSHLAHALIACGRYGEAISEIELVRAADRNAPGLHDDFGSALMGLGRLPEALAEFEKAIAAEPASPSAYVNSGIVLIKEGRYAEADGALTKAISIGPPKAEWYTNLAAAQFLQGRRTEAARSIACALRIDPRYAGALRLRAALERP
ncbi:MAG: tetratricopeptide repeat protein [Capsulimonadaceae bacterium]|nr:tetratricopeptide repeat protein [Capsulimonadaceae bacterium]